MSAGTIARTRMIHGASRWPRVPGTARSPEARSPRTIVQTSSGLRPMSRRRTVTRSAAETAAASAAARRSMITVASDLAGRRKYWERCRLRPSRDQRPPRLPDASTTYAPGVGIEVQHGEIEPCRPVKQHDHNSDQVVPQRFDHFDFMTGEGTSVHAYASTGQKLHGMVAPLRPHVYVTVTCPMSRGSARRTGDDTESQPLSGFAGARRGADESRPDTNPSVRPRAPHPF